MKSFKITFWTGASETVDAESTQAAFERKFGGPVTKTGYNKNRVWVAIDDDGTGHVLNDQGDQCATITAGN